MEGAEHLLLKGALEVDQHIAAADQVDAQEGRILEQILAREHHHLAQRLAHLVAFANRDEMTLHQVGG